MPGSATGIDPTQLQNLEQYLGGSGAAQLKERQATQRRPATAPEQQRAAAQEVQTSQMKTYEALVHDLLRDRRLDEDEQRLLELKARELQLDPEEARETAARLTEEENARFTYLLKQVDALAQDGELSDEDRHFLVLRAQDRGLGEFDAGQLVDRVVEHHRRLGLYRSILEAFLEDDLLDAGENKRLDKKAEELGLTQQERQDLADEVRGERRDPTVDLLASIRRRDEALAGADEKVDLYGRELFRASPDAFLPAADLPPPDDYVVGAGDEFRVNLWGRLAEDYTLDVDAEGRVQFPKVGAVRVGGLTYAEAKRLLQAKAESITGVSAAVAMGQMRTIQVFVVGEAERPGTVSLSPLSGPLHALMAAGGPTPLGSLRGMVHRRRGQVVDTIDLYAFLQKGDNRGAQPLQTGDVVVVPKAQKLVRVVGEVRRPAIYELRGDEGLRAALAFAGGLGPDADAGRIRVDRSQEHARRVTLDATLSPGSGDFPLQDGDVVRVHSLPPEIRNKVSLFGHVFQPGTYAFREGMRVSDLVGTEANLKPDVDLSYAVVLRETGTERARTVLPFHLGRALAGAEPGENLTLQPRDEVYVFARQQFRPPLRARATGEVRTPGLYRIDRGARVADLARLAGGLTPQALLRRAELLRYLPDRSRRTLYVDLAAALAGDPAQNLPLEDEDELVVHKAWSEVLEETVLIEGEVNEYKAKVLAERPGKKASEMEEAEVKRGLSVQERLRRRLDADRMAPEAGRDAALQVAGAAGSTPFRRGTGNPGDSSATTSDAEPIAAALAVPLTRGMTVRDLIFKAGGLTKDAYLPVAHLYRTDPVTKEVTIHTFGLGRALEGSPGDDLPLRDLDHVVIHSAYDFAPVQTVSVSGRVNRPGEYPYAANMTVRDLVLAAGGLTEDAYLGEAEVVRTEVVDGESGRTRTLPFALQKAMAGDPDANLALQPYDRVFIKKIPEWKRSRQVSLDGEVTFPGTYYIAKGEHLSSVLHRAGGFTADAYLRGAIFTRESARLQQQQRLDELRDRLQQAVFRASSQEFQAALSPEDVAAQQQYLASQQALLQKLSASRASGRVVIRLLPLEELEGSEWDIALEDGDALTVPKEPQTVAVVGQVYNPTSLLWEPDRREADHYLQRTGGPTQDAEEDQIYVVRADGTVVSSQNASGGNWWSRRGGIAGLDLYPGDTILVPEKVVRVSYLKEFKDVTQILYQIALSAGVFIAVF